MIQDQQHAIEDEQRWGEGEIVTARLPPPLVVLDRMLLALTHQSSLRTRATFFVAHSVYEIWFKISFRLGDKYLVFLRLVILIVSIAQHRILLHRYVFVLPQHGLLRSEEIIVCAFSVGSNAVWRPSEDSLQRGIYLVTTDRSDISCSQFLQT